MTIDCYEILARKRNIHRVYLLFALPIYLWGRKESQDRYRHRTLPTQTADEPWNTNQLYLHCAIETKSLTAEGMREIQQQKTQKVNNTLAKQSTNTDPSLDQQQSQRKNQTSLALLNRSLPRPSRPLYQGNPLLAKAVIQVAQEFKAASIALPPIKNNIEKIQSNIEADFEKNLPEDVGTQKKLTRKTSVVIHKWSYHSLSKYIRSNAAKLDIAVETVCLLSPGTPPQQAAEIAISAYNSRKHIKK
jgi:hypothetical protein